MFGSRDQSQKDRGVVRNANSPLIAGLFSRKSHGLENDARCVVGFALTKFSEVVEDEFSYRLRAESVAPKGEWQPTTRAREMECRGIVANSTQAEFLPALVTVQEGHAGIPESRENAQPALGELHMNSKVVGKHYFVDVRLRGSRGDLIEKFKAAFHSASLSNRAYVELRCEVTSPQGETFQRELEAEGYTARLPITQIWLEDELSLPQAALWT